MNNLFLVFGGNTFLFPLYTWLALRRRSIQVQEFDKRGFKSHLYHLRLVTFSKLLHFSEPQIPHL